MIALENLFERNNSFFGHVLQQPLFMALWPKSRELKLKENRLQPHVPRPGIDNKLI